MMNDSPVQLFHNNKLSCEKYSSTGIFHKLDAAFQITTIENIFGQINAVLVQHEMYFQKPQISC